MPIVLKYVIKRCALLIAVATLSLLNLAAHAAGDPVNGKAKAETCFGCHAAGKYFNVYPSYRVPKLAGQRPEYLIEALQAYKVGSRKHDTMQANASNLSEQDMQDIAAYLSTAQ